MIAARDRMLSESLTGCVGLRTEDYMLLDASSQRAKSWSCENCRNARVDLDIDVCRTCFWASPEAYTHVALEEVRRLDIEWRGAEVATFDRLRAQAAREGVAVAALVKRLLQG